MAPSHCAGSTPADAPLVLVTGGTGYVGGRLAPRLVAAGYRVRCLVRDPDRLAGRAWADDVEIVPGDVFDAAALRTALQGVRAAYFLIHTMAAGSGFHDRDVRAADLFGRVAAEQGVERIIYLGGLGDPQSDLSEHLRSRQLTGEALGRGGVAVTEFRAAIVVGAGSISFEMIRYLTERLPLMVCPQWVFTRVQPIAVGDLLAYLVAALEVPASAGRVVEVGGADVLTYGRMMMGYARVRGLLRGMVPVPVLTPRLSSYWVHLVTPIPGAMARPLIEGLRNETVVRDAVAAELFPDIRPMPYLRAVARALQHLQANTVETSWADALVTTQGDTAPVRLTVQQGLQMERRQAVVQATPEDVFAVVMRIGGERGYLAHDWAWEVRGAVDRLVGGVGVRRGRRDPDTLRAGDALDFWRVEAVQPGRLLRLRAEMKVPGRAWLQFETLPEGGGTRLVQTAFFAPRGLPGLAYWYGLYPLHGIIFSGMIRALAAQARRTRPRGAEEQGA